MQILLRAVVLPNHLVDSRYKLGAMFRLFDLDVQFGHLFEGGM